MIAVGVLSVVIGYILGSVPFAYIAGRLIGRVDIRQVGGGNVGALNTIREIGPAAGFTVLAADMGKGLLAALIAQWLGVSLIFVFLAGFAAVAGHNWPLFLGFRGGKGAATTLGVLFALAPVEMAISFAIIVAIVLITSNFRLAIGVGLVFLPLIIWLFGGAGSLIAYSVALPLFGSVKYLPALRGAVSGAGSRKDLIFDRRYKPWQKRRDK